MDLYRLLGWSLFRVLVLLVTSGNCDLKITRPPRNETVLEGHRFSFPCKAKGHPSPHIRWFHNGEQMNKNGHNYHISNKSGTLRISNVYVVDRGEYQCRADNGADPPVLSQQVYLTVNAKAAIYDWYGEERRAEYGRELNLTCRALGIPLPSVQWRKNGKSITNRDPDITPYVSNIKHKDYNHVRSTLHVVVTETAEYECEAVNEHVGGVTVVSKRVTVTTANPAKTSRRPHIWKPSVCEPYKGKVCAHILGGRSVFYNQSLASPAGDPERLVLNLLADMNASRFSALCEDAAQKILCHYAFPDCLATDTKPVPRTVCRESCHATQILLCYREWAMVDDTRRNPTVLHGNSYFQLPECSSLPSKWNSSCTEAQIFERKPHEVTSECYVGTGRWYNGTVNVTRSGRACQAWSANFPHKHDRPPTTFVELENSENSCRNPGSEEAGPWCYTTDRFTRWELCDVPKCDVNGTDPEGNGLGMTSRDKTDGQPRFTLDVILIITIIASVVVIVMGLIAGLCYHVFTHNRSVRYNATPQEDLDIDIEKLPQNQSYHLMKEKAHLNPKLETLEYPRNDIVYIRDIGQGAFGRVFKAKAPSIGKEDFTLIAVKMLKEDASDDLQSDFEREASLMANFSHPNIVKLLGVCAIGKPMCLLFEFMSKGDLNEFLRRCSPEHYITHSHSDLFGYEVANIDLVDLLYISKQISSGMVYLSTKGYVHRDLATRNCLVSEDLTVKISDFGLARSVHSVEYYKGTENDAIPIRWMPLEAILYNKFSIQSDVWSFGVVLWEIYSFALQPYYGLTHEEVVKYIKDGKVLIKPDNTIPQVYEIMRTCWHKKPTLRPSFHSLQDSLEALYEDRKKKRKKENI